MEEKRGLPVAELVRFVEKNFFGVRDDEPRKRRRGMRAKEDINPTLEELAVQLGVCERTIQRLLAEKEISVYRADRLAVNLGFHPTLIWGSKFYEA